MVGIRRERKINGKVTERRDEARDGKGKEEEEEITKMRVSYLLQF